MKTLEELQLELQTAVLVDQWRVHEIFYEMSLYYKRLRDYHNYDKYKELSKDGNFGFILAHVDDLRDIRTINSFNKEARADYHEEARRLLTIKEIDLQIMNHWVSLEKELHSFIEAVTSAKLGSSDLESYTKRISCDINHRMTVSDLAEMQAICYTDVSGYTNLRVGEVIDILLAKRSEAVSQGGDSSNSWAIYNNDIGMFLLKFGGGLANYHDWLRNSETPMSKFMLAILSLEHEPLESLLYLIDTLELNDSDAIKFEMILDKRIEFQLIVSEALRIINNEECA